MPNILALDTTTEICSVALRSQDQLLSRVCNEQRKHADSLLAMISDLLSSAGLKRENLDAIAVCHGPGSFTGIRIGVSVAQGLAWGLELPVITVSSLAALALQAYREHESSFVLSCLDARINEVYFAAFQITDGKVTSLSAETLAKPGLITLPEAVESRQWFAAGNGWQFMEDFSVDVTNRLAKTDSQSLPRAQDVLLLAEQLYANKQYCSPDEVVPVYLRDNVANKPV